MFFFNYSNWHQPYSFQYYQNSNYKNSIIYQQNEIQKLLEHQTILQNTILYSKQSNSSTNQQNSNKSANTVSNASNSRSVSQQLHDKKISNYRNIQVLPQEQGKWQTYKKILIFHSFEQKDNQNSKDEEKQIQDEEKQELQEQQDQEYKAEQIKFNRYSETKNIIKNFAKSILSFARKHKQYVKRLLSSLELQSKQFWSLLQRFKCRINSIAELRSFWTFKNNSELAKVFRIISHQYLRKHSLQHIFNSRVKNYSIHLKYRARLLKAIQNHQQLNSIKSSDF